MVTSKLSKLYARRQLLGQSSTTSSGASNSSLDGCSREQHDAGELTTESRQDLTASHSLILICLELQCHRSFGLSRSSAFLSHFNINFVFVLVSLLDFKCTSHNMITAPCTHHSNHSNHSNHTHPCGRRLVQHTRRRHEAAVRHLC